MRTLSRPDKTTNLTVGLIPARWSSTRFEGKPLALINNIPMIQRVYDLACQVKQLDTVVVLTDDDRIVDYCSKNEMRCIVVEDDVRSGTDRCAKALELLDGNIFVNIQGDEPLLDPKVLDGLIKIFDDSKVSMGTVVSRKIGIRDYLDRNVVKAFLDENQNAYDFKRDIYDSDIGGVFRHIGFYGFDRDALLQFSSLPASKNEIKYSLEQFRALDNGIKIKAFISNAQQQAIDSPEDLDRVLSQLNKIKDSD